MLRSVFHAPLHKVCPFAGAGRLSTAPGCGPKPQYLGTQLVKNHTGATQNSRKINRFRGDREP